jgi:hypothetical protein
MDKKTAKIEQASVKETLNPLFFDQSCKMDGSRKVVAE